MESNLGCSRKFAMNTSSGFICGVPNAWGAERLCQRCNIALKRKWLKEDLKSKDPRIREITKLKLKGELNY
jgi:hypothetical protein